MHELKRQCDGCGIDYEIFLCDDASDENIRLINREASVLSNVKYKQLEKNHGRARIRNLMAREAKFENLLFMDCDSEVVSDDYIKAYIAHCGSNRVICGGRAYSTHPPADKKKLLRWKTGKRKEEIKAAIRNRNSYRSFMTNNFLTPKNIILKNPFDEIISGYGHEDTLFGFELRRKNIPVIHIDNPLMHIGLEDAEEFLIKTDNATKNLWYIYQNKRLSQGELKEIPLMKTYFSLKKIAGDKIIRAFFNLFQKKIRRNLLSENPFVFLFDIYKIGRIVSYS